MSQQLDSGAMSQFSMLDLFRMEADQQTRTLTEGLLALERRGEDPATIDSLMRAAHSIKGAAAIVGLEVVVRLAHRMEDAFLSRQKGQVQFTSGRIDVLLGGVDLILQFSQLTERDMPAWLAQNAVRIDNAMLAIEQIAQAVPDYVELLSLANETRISAQQLAPMIAALNRSKRNQASLLQAIEQLHEALVRSADPALVKKSTLVLQKTHPLRQQLHDHMAAVEHIERRLLTASNKLVEEILALRMRPLRDGAPAPGQGAPQLPAAQRRGPARGRRN